MIDANGLTFGDETMLFSLLMACWMDSSTLPTLDVNVINFTNEYLEIDDVTVRIYDSPLLCPDGLPASFFLVIPESENPLPVAIVFHSGAMAHQSLVDTPEDFKASGRLLSQWASSRVWETLNLSRKTLDTAVTDLGTLPTALVNAGVAQIYPTNCWGDLWHNGVDTQPNDAESEGFTRQGLDMAYFAVDILSNTELATELGFASMQEKLIATNPMLIGLGTGGQAIIELSKMGVDASAVLFDSSPASFAPYMTGDFPKEKVTLSRIFGTMDLEDAALDTATLPNQTAWIWSNGESQHPISSVEMGAEEVATLNASWVLDVNAVGHVFSNRDYTLAEQATQFLRTGSPTVPSAE